MGIFNRKNNGPLIPEVQSEGQTAQYAPRQGQGQSQYAARDQRPSGGASAYHTNGQNMRSSGRDQAPVFHVEGHNLAPPPYSSGGNGQSLARGSSRGSDPYNAAFGASNGSGSFGRTSSHGSGGGGGGRDPYARTNSNGSGNDAAHNELLRGADRGDRSGSDPYANRGGNNANSSSSPYDRPGASVEDAARNELFAGMQPNQKQVQATRQYGYDGREHEEDFDEEEEIEGIKQDMRRTKQDSLASTRNTLQTARQAEETARNTMGLLGDQSGRLANTERHFDVAKANSQRAEDKTDELQKLKRSIFRPAIVWNKDKKRAAQEQKILDRHNMERDDRDKARGDVAETNRRLGAAADSREGHQIVAGKMAARAQARKKYQFEATASDDELEDELDENLDETLQVTRRLKMMATAMGDEVNNQNTRISSITDKAHNLDARIQQNTSRLNTM